MEYLAWNDAIGERFFNPDRAGARVFLYVTKEVVAEIGGAHDADLNDFVAAVSGGPPWNTRRGLGLCQQALQAVENWRDRGLEYPPYLNYLALFVMAGTVDVGFARHSYYPGLRFLLGETPEAGMYPSFQHMFHLWDDLATWANQDKQGEWGVFDLDIAGEWIHVGLPKAQTLLTEEERLNLPLLFADCGLDPTSPPADDEFSYLLSEERHRYLRHQTKELLRSRREGDSAIRMALVEILLNDLRDWDGAVPARAEDGTETETAVGNLRLTMTLDSTARTARFGLRCRSNREYPDEGLLLSGDAIPEPLICREDWQGWSFPLANAGGASAFDASRLDWHEGLSLVDREHSWKATLSKRSVRVMVNAKPSGFDGFVEQSQLPQEKLFYVLAREEHAEAIQAWGRDCCDGFCEIAATAGLPAWWRLFSVERANSDAGIRDKLPYLAFPTTLRIQFLGGLQVKGNHYFTFALPRIEVSGAVEGATVFCNDHPLDRDPEIGLYTIPDALRARRFVVEVKRNGERIRSRSIYSVETVAWRDVGAGAGFDRFGRRAADGATDRCVGPIVEGFTPTQFDPGTFLPPGDGRRVYFIGRNPGEIVECPAEALPDDWRPVWAVPMHTGEGTAVYCGANPEKEVPGTGGSNDRRRRRQWREVLWNLRRRIASPSHPALARLWREYKGVAKHVR